MHQKGQLISYHRAKESIANREMVTYYQFYPLPLTTRMGKGGGHIDNEKGE